VVSFSKPEYVELRQRELCIDIGYGPIVTVPYGDIDCARQANNTLGPGGRLLTMLMRVRNPGAAPFADNTEILLRRRRWIFMVIPFMFLPLPFVWPTKKFRLPIINGPAFAEELEARLEA
jgi:hypothetical protein